MPEDFDPYLRWLEIPPAEQPPNHYRLLRVKLFESDPQVIERTAERLTQYLQARAKGQRLAEAERLMAEVAAARDCLLDADRKAEYDAGLRADTPPAAAEPAIAEADSSEEFAAVVEVADGPAESEPSRESPSTVARPKQRQPAAEVSPVKVEPAPAAESGGSFFDGMDFGAARSPGTRKPAGSVNGDKSPAARSGGRATPQTQTASRAASAGAGSYGSRAAAKKPQGKLQGWQIGAIVGGGVLFLIIAVAVVANLASAPEQSTKPPPPKPVASAPIFGPSTVKGPIHDITVSSPTGSLDHVALPLERHGDLLFLPVKINGQDAGKFLVDTGVAEIIISSKLADKLNLADGGQTSIQGPAGKQAASQRKIKSLALGQVHFDDSNLLPARGAKGWEITAADMAPWEGSLQVPIDGVLGCEIWSQMPFSIDAARKELIFFNRHTFKMSADQHSEYLSLIDRKPGVSANLDGIAPPDDNSVYVLATGSLTDLLLGDSAPAKKCDQLTLFGQNVANPTTALLKEGDLYHSTDPRQLGAIGSHVLANYQLIMDFQNQKYLAVKSTK